MLLASGAATLPGFLDSTAQAMTRALGGLSSLPGVPDERVLVVVQLSGGNDGLNTVVPFGMPQYYRARPAIGIPEKDVLKLSQADGVGLHPQMTAMKEMYDKGLVSIVQGVGYPNPNRSHFKSMDIWHTADTTATGDGWLGRYFDAECCGYGKGESGTPDGSAKNEVRGPAGIGIGRSAPLAMQGRQVKPVSFESPELFKWSGEDLHESLREPYDALNRLSGEKATGTSNASFLTRTALDAQVSSDLIRSAVSKAPLVSYPQNDLSRQLAMVAQMIRAGLKTRVYYVTLGGFDTHAGQGGAQGNHGRLLNTVASSINMFYKDLGLQENADRVLTLMFSEFGRRVGQNASGGTDHGTAAPAYLFGPMVNPGIYGDHPSLSDLDEGDLRHKIDFRSVYATILDQWMKADSKQILDGTYRNLKLLKKAEV
jgi:uncharacterized protein (DUF1501 family)